MSFDTLYPNRKDWRQLYRHSKRFDQCRNRDSCPECRANRLHRHVRQDLRAVLSATVELA